MAWFSDLAPLGQPQTTDFSILQNPSDRFPMLSQLGALYDSKPAYDWLGNLLDQPINAVDRLRALFQK